MVSDTEDTDVSRRSVLKKTSITAGAFSIPATGLSVATQGDADDYIEIDYARSGDTVVETRQVPREWFEDVQRARNVSANLTDQLGDVPGINAIGITPRDETVNGFRKKSVFVQHSGERTPVTLPDHVDEVPIETRRGEADIEWLCYDNDYDPLRGGIASQGGTLTCRVEYNSDYYLLHVRHVFMPGGDGCASGDPTGLDVYQNGDYIGQVEEARWDHDVALIEFDEANSPRDSMSAWIVDQDGVLCGHLTPNGLDYLASNNEEVKGRGTASCQMSGEVKDYDVTLTGCENTNFHDVVNIDPVSEPGDSGAPFYRENSDQTLYMSHINSGRYPHPDHGEVAWGAAAYALSQNYGYDVGTGSDLQC